MLSGLQVERMTIAAGYCGNLEAILDLALEYAKERPRSPARAFCRKSPSCTHIGLSRPKDTTVARRSAWVASGLMRMSTGLPMA